MVFLIFHFFKFQITIVKNLMEKLSFFIVDFEGFMKFYFVTNTFDLQTFDDETTALLKFF